MSPGITGSVGRWEKGARNRKADVLTVQRLLKRAGKALGAPALDPKGLDGLIAHPPGASATVNAIEVFQRRLTSSVDGIVDVGGHTWDALLEAAGEKPTPPAEPDATVVPVASAEFFFPFAAIPAQSWEERPRAFASPRDGGRRLHAGCDLYFPQGTAIHAIADGLVTRGPYPFYCQTFALEIDHGSILARYGEIQSRTEVHAGDRVSAGQKIAKVGHLVGVKVPSDMLHFELYDKSRSGTLTVGSGPESAMKNGVPFMRRKDLIDSTSRLNQWRANLPPA